MAKKIRFSLDSRSIDAAIRELEKYKNDLRGKAESLRERVADEMAELARLGFDGAIADDITELSGGARTANVTVETQSNGNVTLVVAKGEDAIWVEFGSGVYHNGAAGSSPHPRGEELGMVIGGYGDGRGKRNAWAFRDGETTVWTHGAPARMPMYNAMTEVLDRIYEIAKEVWNA